MINFNLIKLNTIDSTNDYLERELENGNINKDTIVIARNQTNGHGSKGRTFISPENVGIYFTFLHFYDPNDNQLDFITQKTAVAIYEVFNQIFNIEFKIKWINDLYYNDKKVCGILCRNLIKYNAVIIGIGIDLFKNNNLADEIKDIAGYIFENKKDLLDKLNIKDNKNNCSKKNIYEDFKIMENMDDLFDDEVIWEPDHIVVEIVFKILQLIKIKGLPKIYIEKNIIKDEKIYEDCNLEC